MRLTLLRDELCLLVASVCLAATCTATVSFDGAGIEYADVITFGTASQNNIGLPATPTETLSGSDVVDWTFYATTDVVAQSSPFFAPVNRKAGGRGIISVAGTWTSNFNAGALSDPPRWAISVNDGLSPATQSASGALYSRIAYTTADTFVVTLRPALPGAYRVVFYGNHRRPNSSTGVTQLFADGGSGLALLDTRSVPADGSNASGTSRGSAFKWSVPFTTTSANETVRFSFRGNVVNIDSKIGLQALVLSAVQVETPNYSTDPMQRSADWRQRMMTFLQGEDLEACSLGSSGATAVFRTRPNMDLAHNLEKHAARLPSPDVPLAPALVVGEGPAADNGTLVRVLNEYQVPRTQFSAFAPEVKGGVHVAALRRQGRVLIAATPISPSAGQAAEVRVFDTDGLLERVITPPSYLVAPFVIATGQFLTRGVEGDELIAVASRDVRGDAFRVLLYDGAGTLVRGLRVPRIATLNGETLGGVLQLAPFSDTVRDKLLAYLLPAKEVAVVDASGANQPTIWRTTLSAADPASLVGQSAFAGELLVAAANSETARSLGDSVSDQLAVTRRDFGYKENLYFSPSAPADSTRTRYVVRGGYNGSLTQPRVWQNWTSNPAQLTSTNPTDWMTGVTNLPAIYGTGAMLFPHWTNWMYGNVQSYNVNDPVLGNIPGLMALKADNTSSGNGLAAKGDANVDRHLLLTPRLRLWLSARGHLANPSGYDPELLFGVNTLHEWGYDNDYSPLQLRDFRTYLKSRYGTVAALNEVFGTSFAASADFSSVDAPRGLGRGAWDVPTTKNTVGSAFGTEFYDFCRYITSGDRFVDSFRDALLAGYPPELQKNHRSNAGAQLSWLTSGVSTGISNYMPTDQMAQRQLFQLVVNSGYRNYTFGEFPMERGTYGFPSNEAYTSFRYYWENGLISTNLTSLHNTNPRYMREAELMLEAENLPRPGLTGGVGGVRAFRQFTQEGVKRSNIVQVGAGPNRQGLLKSVDADGRWDGRVYVTPFHAKVETQTLTPSGTNPLTFGPVASLSHGDQIELSFVATGSGTVRVSVRHGADLASTGDNHELADSVQTFTATAAGQRFRYVLRNQSPLNQVKVRLLTAGTVTLSDLSANLQLERALRHNGGTAPIVAHRGGVTFDLLDRGSLPVRDVALAAGVAEGAVGDVSAPIAGESVVDTTAPIWPQDSDVVVRLPFHELDGRPTPFSIYAEDPVLAVRLVAKGATDNDQLAGYEAVDAGVVVATAGPDGVLTLPVLPQLASKTMQVRAFDRAGNRSAAKPVSFTVPGLYDFTNASSYGSSPHARRVMASSLYSAAAGCGWTSTAGITEGQWWLGGNGIVASYAIGGAASEFKVDLPSAGAWRVVAVYGTKQESNWIVSSLSYQGTVVSAARSPYRQFIVDRFTVNTSTSQLALVLGPATRLSALMVYPATGPTSVAPWTPSFTLGQGYFTSTPGFHGGNAAYELSWTAAPGAVYYRVFVNGEISVATPRPAHRLEGLPVDVPLTIRVEAVDALGNVVSATTTAPMMAGSLIGSANLYPVFSYNEPGTGEQKVWFNGALASDRTGTLPAHFQNVIWNLSPGLNIIAVDADSGLHSKIGGSVGLGSARYWVTPRWKVSLTAPAGWQTPAFDDSSWASAFYLPVSGYGSYTSTSNTQTWVTGILPSNTSQRGAREYFRLELMLDRARAAAYGGPASLTATDTRLRAATLANYDQQNVSLATALTALASAISTADGNTTLPQITADDSAGPVSGAPVTLKATSVPAWSALRELAWQADALVEIQPNGEVRLRAHTPAELVALVTGASLGAPAPQSLTDGVTGARYFRFARNPQAFETVLRVERETSAGAGDWTLVAQRDVKGAWTFSGGAGATETVQSATGLVETRIDQPGAPFTAGFRLVCTAP